MTAKRRGRKPTGGAPSDAAAPPQRTSAAAAPPPQPVAAPPPPAAATATIRPEAPPGLHVVATPIGAARDVTLRALDLLAGADVIAAEDMRSARRLLAMHGIALGGRRLVSYSDATAERARPALLAVLREGASVALISEAGTPLVSDPGFKLVRAAREAGVSVTAAPGASALLAALAVAGLPTDRFLFLGFLPTKGPARRAALAEVAPVRATLVIYESPRRVAETLADLAATLGPTREAALCRELTKRFEEVRRGPLATLADGARTDPPRGEAVLVVGPPPAGAPDAAETAAATASLEAALTEALAGASLRDAVAEVSRTSGRPRREVYAAALRLTGSTEP